MTEAVTISSAQSVPLDFDLCCVLQVIIYVDKAVRKFGTISRFKFKYIIFIKCYFALSKKAEK